jgi:integrase
MSNQQPTSTSTDLAAARSLYAEAIDRDLIIKDPCRGVRVGRFTTEKVPALTLPEAQGVLDAVRAELALPGLRLVAARDNFLLTLCMVMGPRATEIRRLAWGDLELDGDIPTVQFMRKFRKHDVQRAPDALIEAARHYRGVWEEELGYPPLPGDAMAIALWAGCAGRLRAGRPSESIAPMSDTALYGMISSRLKDLGLSGRKLGTHRLRATAATLAWRGLVKQGNADPAAVQRLMAHEHLSTTVNDYIRLSDEMEQTAGNAVGITRLGAQGV